MEESGQGEVELRRRNLEGNTREGDFEGDARGQERTSDTTEQAQEVEVKEKVVDSEAEDRAVVGEEIAKSIGQDKPPEVRKASDCDCQEWDLIRGATIFLFGASPT